MEKKLLIAACVLGALAVVLGAYGAHGLKSHLSSSQIASFETGVRYQFYHVFAMMVAGILFYVYQQGGMLTAGWLFMIGIFFFSGSIYLLSTKELTGMNTSFLGPITPIGGLFFIAGWITLLINILKNNPSH